MTTLFSEAEFTRLASEDQIAKTAQALEANGIHAIVVETGEEAREYVLSMIPPGKEVYNPPSRTADQIGLTEAIQTATNFHPVRARLNALDRSTQRDEMRRLIAS